MACLTCMLHTMSAKICVSVSPRFWPQCILFTDCTIPPRVLQRHIFVFPRVQRTSPICRRHPSRQPPPLPPPLPPHPHPHPPLHPHLFLHPRDHPQPHHSPPSCKERVDAAFRSSLYRGGRPGGYKRQGTRRWSGLRGMPGGLQTRGTIG